MKNTTIHEGHNVKRIREILGIKQDVLAMGLGLSQQAVSALEQKEALDKEMIDKIATILKITPEAIKNFNEESVINNISCTFTDQSANNVNYNFCPIDKILELVEENKTLYERLLQAEREKVTMLEKMLFEKKNNFI